MRQSWVRDGEKTYLKKSCLSGQVCASWNNTRKEELRTMQVIRSRGHEIYAEEVNRIALSANDDKRIIREDKSGSYCGI